MRELAWLYFLIFLMWAFLLIALMLIWKFIVPLEVGNPVISGVLKVILTAVLLGIFAFLWRQILFKYYHVKARSAKR